MTLIIGRICQGVVRVDSDSMITDPNVVSNRNSIFSGVLKTIILNPNISISFAGGVEIAQSAIEKIYESKNFNIQSVKNNLLQSNMESDYSTDFLITSLENQALLYKIKDGKIDISNQTQWIGDINGFNLFQKEFLPNLKSSDPRHILETQTKAFDQVVNSGNIPGIGGFRITIHTTKFGLEYLMQLKNHLNGNFSIVVQGSGSASIPIPFGSSQMGSYATSYLTSNNPNDPAIAIHFPYGKFGALFCFRVSREIILIKNVDGDEFIEEVRQDYKISLGGLTMH